MTDQILGFLRRKATLSDASVYYEYLFLPIDEINFKFNAQKIAPTLPANNASTLTGIDEATGNRGLNFQLDIGMQRMQFNVRTTLYEGLAATQIPELESTDIPPYGSGDARFLNYAYASTGMTAGDVGTHVITAKNLRDHLLNFVADQSFIDSQSDVEYSEFCFGYPEWNTNAPRTDMPGYDTGGFTNDTTIDTIAGTDYRMWYGMIDSVDGGETAGVTKQFPLNFTFTVGVPVI